ncbi:DUF4129 domain-containing protein [Streptomyces sp. NPDC058045]|uniref:DUF4129 domain-containing protein n=1 Tax=Streptomyces sp. NPDC058045 TaxID=3346311 RepID=UPI0036E709E1
MRGTGDVLRAAGGDGGPPVRIGREAAREAARRELSEQRYHEHDPGLLQQLMDHVWRWIGDLLAGVAGATPGGALGLVVILLAVAALAAALWWRLGTPQRRATTAEPLFADQPRTAAQYRAAAEAHAAQQHWSLAVQDRMRAVVRALEERALLEPRAGRTADEAATEAARPLPALRPQLRTAARDFDDVTYGGRPGDATAYARLTDLDQALERARPVLTTTAPGTGGTGSGGPPPEPRP